MESSFSEENERRHALMEAMFREHYTEVHRYISNKVRQPDVADDLTSLVFLKAYRWLLEDRGMSKMRSWLYTTARTTIADYWQEQQKWFSLPLEMIEDSVAAPFEQLDDEQALERVQHLLHVLPTRERQVLYLRYLQGYTAAEVGRELGLNASHVRVLQLRALRHAALLEAEERSFSQMHEPVNEPVTIYTEQGQRVLDLAKEEALSFNHHSIGAEHLLLGILREGSAADSLIERGTTLERVRAGLLFLRGKGQPDPDADLPLTPQSQQLLALAGREAQDRGETAINPQHILHALQSEERGRGVARGMIQLLGVGWLKVQKPPVEESENERTLHQMIRRIEQHPALSPEEEQQLAHLVALVDTEKRLAERLNEVPDHHLVEESQDAYFRLIYASQQLVLSVAQEYFASGRDWRALINAGNIGLTYAISKYGMKTQIPFRAYAAHWIHLEIIEGVLEQ